MPEISLQEGKASKKRKIDQTRDENDHFCEVIEVKRVKADPPSLFNSIFQQVRSWVKRTTSQHRPKIFGLLSERNSAADAIAHGGQYLDEAGTDMFMPQPDHTACTRVVGNGNYTVSTNLSTNSHTSSDYLRGAQAPTSSLPVIRIPRNQLAPAYISNSKLRQKSQQTTSLMDHASEYQKGTNGRSATSSEINKNAGLSMNYTSKKYSQLPGQISEHSDSGNNSLHKTYSQRHDVRAKEPSNTSIYNKIYSNTSSYLDRSRSSKKTTLQKCFDLDEKERYKRLLREFSLTDMPPSSQSLTRLSIRPTITTVTEQPIRRFLFAQGNTSTVNVLETPASTPSNSPGKSSQTHSTPLSQSQSTSAPETRSKTASQLAGSKQHLLEAIPPSDIAVKCDALMKQMDQIKTRAATRLSHQKRMAIEEEAILSAYQKKREEEDELLKQMVQQRLRLTPSVILDDVPVEEPAYDEFPALSEEAEMMVNKALSPGPNNVLSEAFRLKITRKDLATLRGLEWLNDEIVNFYFNLIQERSNQESLASVYVFNTFFYPTLMKSGHARLKRWTKQVDIFSKDFVLIPIHLGMHWCLACINFRDHSINYYDSMGGTKWDCVMALKKYIEDESLDKKKQPFDTSNWTLDCVQDIPQQMNGSDCGVFTCKYAEYLSRDAEFTFTQEHMPYFRRRMVYEILTKSLL